MPSFLHVTPREFLLTSFRLGKILYSRNIRPKHAISVWRGGTPVGLGVDAYYRMQGISMNHTTIATESYHGVGIQKEVVVKGLDHVINVICREDDLLILDDVYESGNTIREIIETIKREARANAPRNIYIGTLHSKPENHQFSEYPVISVEELPGNIWIDYPHELADLVNESPDDPLIKQKDPHVWNILHNKDDDFPSGPLAFNYLTPEKLYYDSIRLGLKLALEEKFLPDFLIALWPGGINAGLPIHEVYKYLHSKKIISKVPDHISINTTKTHLTYRSNIIGMKYLTERIEKHHKILLIEVAFKSGRLMSDVVGKLKESLRRNLSLDNVSIATVYYNPCDDSTWTVKPFKDSPDFYLREVDTTLVYPTNLYRLSSPYENIRSIDEELFSILYT
ncbi:MAG: phosphoribosyltransferase [Deltaproteobacteria bacterium]|nr:phosphoribosyltransferase [Deltaproteobacteria bacterium]